LKPTSLIHELLKQIVGVLYHHMNNAQLTADLILKCAEADLVDYNGELKLFIVCFEISNDVQEELDRFQTGYRASALLDVTVRDVDQAGALASRVVEMGANTF
jgi:hypothetical protein